MATSTSTPKKTSKKERHESLKEKLGHAAKKAITKAAAKKRK